MSELERDGMIQRFEFTNKFYPAMLAFFNKMHSLSSSPQLDELMLPYSFDISIFSRIHNELLRQNILRDGKIVNAVGAEVR